MGARHDLLTHNHPPSRCVAQQSLHAELWLCCASCLYSSSLTPTRLMTGLTRNGKCEERDDDAGSHHICIDLTSTSTNFCQATGQPNWCAQEGMCMGGKGKCPRKNWCVCQW